MIYNIVKSIMLNNKSSMEHGVNVTHLFIYLKNEKEIC